MFRVLSNQALHGQEDYDYGYCWLSLVTFVKWAISELTTRGSGKHDDDDDNDDDDDDDDSEP